MLTSWHLNEKTSTSQVYLFVFMKDLRFLNLTDMLLITKEAYWSAHLFSRSPFELNKKHEFHSKNGMHNTSF